MIPLSSYDADVSFDQFFLQFTVEGNDKLTKQQHQRRKQLMTRWFFLSRVHHLVYRINRRDCCYSNLNLLSIILFIKNRSLCTRSMYLLISLSVADLLAGGLSVSANQLLTQVNVCPFLTFYSVLQELFYSHFLAFLFLLSPWQTLLWFL